MEQENQKTRIENTVQALISRKVRHKKKGTVMGEETWIALLSHLEEEIREFANAIGESYTPSIYPNWRAHQLEELGDIYGLLVHAAIKAGFTMAQVEERELQKLEERFE